MCKNVHVERPRRATSGGHSSCAAGCRLAILVVVVVVVVDGV